MASIQGVYLAIFGRPADPGGLEFYSQATGGGANLDAIGDLSGSAEYKARFTDLDSSQIINSIYQSLFGRDADAGGLKFYVDELDSGRRTINDIAVNVLDGAKNADATIIDNKLEAADTFTSHLNLAAERDAYKGDFAAEVGRDFLDGITADPSTIPNDEITDLQILFLFRDGEAPAMSSSHIAPAAAAEHVEIVGMGSVIDHG